MPVISFSVDAALLRELGERLVGRPHIALAELIKNSYDADATVVTLKFDQESIEVIDNGSGMTFDQFRDFWMRIGSPHKQTEGYSRRLRRPLTGSKGVGRLAVQFLASRIDMTTVSVDDMSREITASVDWDQAVVAGELTSAQARYTEAPASFAFADGSPHGTSLLLRGLRHAWLPGLVADVAREIWSLQPPFRPNPRLEGNDPTSFQVQIQTSDDTAAQAFRDQMRPYLDIWYARIVGRLDRTGSRGDLVKLFLEFADGSGHQQSYTVEPLRLQATEFEIRVYHLAHRQRAGVRVDEARQYLNRFGGVHIYDGGFHLPYYGPDTDWLNIERDHSHRLSLSKLLPRELQVERGLNYLPTQSRLFGVVHVDTSFERESAVDPTLTHEALTIQVTRDRLVENEAFETLRKIVRWALDYYAMVEARQALQRTERQRPVTDSDEKPTRRNVLARYKGQIPSPVYSSLVRDLQKLDTEAETERAVLIRRSGLVAALATAGIAALGFDHELGKQLRRLDDFVVQIEDVLRGGKPSARELQKLATSLREWIDRARSTRALFAHLSDEDNRSLEDRLNARAVVHQTKLQLGSLLRGIPIETSEMDPTLLLPPATFAEWAAVFQNVFLNSVNAMMDSKVRRIAVRTESTKVNRALIIEDTGVGVKLGDAERLFEPFERETKIAPERRELGLGGTGLGLTIVRTIAENRNSSVRFVQPREDFNTALRLEWRESA